MISIPLSSGSVSSSSVRPARPPPKSVLKVSWKFRLIAEKASENRGAGRFVDLLDGLTRLRDRVDQILALRGQKAVARLELVELLDRHHVHRTQPVDPGSQPCDRLFSRQRFCRDVRGEQDVDIRRFGAGVAA